MATPHTTGTVAVTNGSATVTGTGTDWQTALITAGVIFIGGNSYPIASVQSDTQLTLALPYAGATGGGLAYAIDRASAVQQQTASNASKIGELLNRLPLPSAFIAGFLESLDAEEALGVLGAFWPGNVLGTVSQAGGVPTGALIERGSNANGDYARFADGTQICWLSVAVSNVEVNSHAYFNLGVTPAWPADFVVIPHACLTYRGANSPTVTVSSSWGATRLASVLLGNFWNSALTFNGTIYVIGVGRWF